MVSAAFGGTPTAEIHVQVPSVAATGTLTYIWVLDGNSGQTAQPAASSTYGAQAVWNENGTQNYQGVWHWGTPATLSLADSTSNALTNTNHGVTAGTGELGGAATFTSASSTYLDFGTTLNMGLNNWTLSTWIKTSQTGTSPIGIIAKSVYGSGPGRWFIVMNDGSDMIEANFASVSGISASVAASSSVYQNGAWHRISATYDRAGLLLLYIDGAQVGTQPSISAYSGTNWTNADNLFFGVYNNLAGTGPQTGTYYNGLLDETRIAATSRSASWITAEYANQSAPGTFTQPSGSPLPTISTTLAAALLLGF